MAELQRMAERMAQLAERLAILEAGQLTAANTGENCLISGSVLVAQHYSLILEYLEVGNGSQIEIANGGSLVLVG